MLLVTDPQTWLVQHDPLRVVALRDPVVEATGHDPRSPYVETFYLPLAGPSAVLAARRLAAWLEESPEGVTVPLGSFASELGLGTGNGRNAPLPRVLARLVVFGLAGLQSDAYAVRLAFPPLARRHLRRLPPHLVLAHELIAEEGAAVERVVPTGALRE